MTNTQWIWCYVGVNSLFNADDLLKLIKKTAVEAFNASKPTDVVFGKVISISPLKIKVDQKLILTSAQLVLTKTVTNDVLISGDELIMVRMSGGQKYIVMDKVG